MAKWVPSLLDVILVPLLYLLVQSIFKKEKVALLSVLLFACLQNHIAFSSGFIRETIALILAVCCLYLYFSARHSRHYAIRYGLSITCLFGTIFAHHLTSFLLLVFLSTHFVVTKVVGVQFFRRAFFGDKIEGEKVTIVFLFIGFVTTIAYWIYVVSFPLYTLGALIKSVFNPSLWGGETYASISGVSATSIKTIRGNVIFYGFYFFTIIFAIILLYQLWSRAKKFRAETYSFTLFLFVCGIVGFLNLYAVPAAAFPDRFLTYGWLFGFVPLAIAILKGKHKWLKRVGVFLLVAFMLFNIYMIDPTAWDTGAVGVPAAPSFEEYTLANTFNFSRGKIFGDQTSVLAIFDVHNNLGTGLSSYAEFNLTQFDWVIIQKKVLELEKSYYPEPRTETIAVLEHLAFEDVAGYNRIYESDNLVVVVNTPSGS